MSQNFGESIAEMPLINGAFDHFTDATSLTAAGYLGVTWQLLTLGTGGSPAATVSKQQFTFGTAEMGTADGDPVGNLINFLRWNQTALASTTNPELQNRIEHVRTFAGRKVTLQGYYRANQAINVGLRQSFGSGGSPSADVDTALQTLPVTFDVNGVAQWRTFRVTFDLPSLTGKTAGTTANTSFLAVRVLGPLNVVFQYDLADIRLTEGGQGQPSARRRPPQFEKEMVKRYYDTYVIAAPVSTQSPAGVLHRREMRIAPTMTNTGATSASVTVDGYTLISTGAAGNITVIADARL